jgi:hypothetical protein
MTKARAHYFHMLRGLKHHTFLESGNDSSLYGGCIGGNLPYIWRTFRRLNYVDIKKRHPYPKFDGDKDNGGIIFE